MGAVKKAVSDVSDFIVDTTSFVTKPGKELLKSLQPNVPSGSTAQQTATGAADAPSLALDTEAAKRRKRALALQRGFLSTRRATGDQDAGSLLQPTLTGKTKLGQ